MDEIDRKILEQVQREGRMSRTELGRRVGLSGTATADRLRRLEESGVIRGYRAELDPTAVGYDVAAILRIRPTIGQLKKIADVAQRTPEVVECHRVTGEDCYVMKMYVRSIGELESVLDRFTPLGQTTTSIIHSSPVPGRGVAMPDDSHQHSSLTRSCLAPFDAGSNQ